MSILVFSKSQFQQYCLFHDLPPLLSNQAVASETSRKANDCCVSEEIQRCDNINKCLLDLKSTLLMSGWM